MVLSDTVKERLSAQTGPMFLFLVGFGTFVSVWDSIDVSEEISLLLALGYAITGVSLIWFHEVTETFEESGNDTDETQSVA